MIRWILNKFNYYKLERYGIGFIIIDTKLMALNDKEAIVEKVLDLVYHCTLQKFNK